MLAVATTAAAASVPLFLGVITCWDGPPTSQTALAAGAWRIGALAGTHLPVALPTPVSPAAPISGTQARPVSLGGRSLHSHGHQFSLHAATPAPKSAFLHGLAASHSLA